MNDSDVFVTLLVELHSFQVPAWIAHALTLYVYITFIRFYAEKEIFLHINMYVYETVGRP